MEQQAGEAGLASLLPLLLISVSFAVTGFLIARRKGKNPALFAVLSFVPLINITVIFYLVALTDKEVYDRLERIEALLRKGES